MRTADSISTPKPSEWYCFRECYLAEWGEYELTSRWKAERYVSPEVILEEAVYGWRENKLFHQYRVRQVCSISGFYNSRGRLIPKTWTCGLNYGRFNSQMHWHGKCKSVMDALRQMSSLDLDDEIQALLKRAYGSERHECVYMERDGVFVPYMSDLGIGYTYDKLPSGTYQVISKELEYKGEELGFQPKLIGMTLKAFGGGYSAHYNGEVPQEYWGDEK